MHDDYYPDNSHDSDPGPYDTPEKALAAARSSAKATGFSNVSYWVTAEYGNIVEELEGYHGST